MKIVVTGGTGFIGKSLVRRLKEKGHSVIVLTRQVKLEKKSKDVRTLRWDGKNSGGWVHEVEGVDAFINLAGESIQGRWNNEKKENILSSRLDSTRCIVQAIRLMEKKPHVLIHASAVGYYGDVPEGEVTESSPKGSGFLADVCAQWEQEALKAQDLGVRTVIFRLGVVLSKRGGALKKMLPPFRFFLGGPLGNGTPWFPWVSRRDVRRALLFALEKPELSGPVNLVAPQSVTMNEFSTVLGRVLGRPSSLRVPAWMCKILFGEMSQVMLEGQKVVPKKLLDAGFRFRFPTLYEALASTLSH